MYLSLMLGFQNATSGLASVINVRGRSVEKVSGTQYAVNLLFRGFVIASLVGLNDTGSAFSDTELNLATTSEIILSVAETGV